MSRDPRAVLTWICDPDPGALARGARIASEARTTTDLRDVLQAADVDAVVIATPARTHAELALAAIATGRHVLVEKPLALDARQAAAVTISAERAGVVGMVGHLMVYHPAVQALTEVVRAGRLGEIFYLTSVRANLGRARSDENALWSFGPHDLSMLDLLLQREPTSVIARGESYLRPGIADVVFVNLSFAGAPLMAQIQLSWLNPRKERRLVVVGSKLMAEFDDCSDAKLQIFDRGYDRPPDFADFAEYLTLRNGAVTPIDVAFDEPLRIQAGHFLDCIVEHKTPLTDLRSGTRIVRWLEAAQASLDANGKPVAIQPEVT